MRHATERRGQGKHKLRREILRLRSCDPPAGPGNRLDLDPNFIPDPVAAAVLAKNVPLPSPNRPTPDNRFIGNEGLPNTSNEYLIKGDFQLIPEASCHARVFPVHRLPDYCHPGQPAGMGALQLRLPAAERQRERCLDSLAASVNQVWLSYSRMMAGRISSPAKSLAAYGSDINVQGTPSLPQISVANFFTLANAISGPLAGDNVYGLRDVFSTTRGRHTINAGGEVYLEKDLLETLLNNYGVFSLHQLPPCPTPHQDRRLHQDRRRHGGLPHRPSQHDEPGFAGRRQ